MRASRIQDYLEILAQDHYVTSEDIALKLEISSRTVRNELKELNHILQMNGAMILTKPKLGNILVVRDPNTYQSYKNQFMRSIENKLPETSQERVSFLMDYLLQEKEYVKLEDLCEMLYISKTSLSQDLKIVREILNEYHLTIVSKPNYGIKIEGNEFDLRLCIANFTIEHTFENLIIDKDKKKTELRAISEILASSFQDENYRISDTPFQNLIIHIFIALQRIEENQYVPLDGHIKETLQEKEVALARKIVTKLEDHFHVVMPENEVYYIAIHLAAKETIQTSGDCGNMVISDEINNMVSEMLNEISDVFNVDFSDDFDLRMMLALHMIPFQVRIQYGIFLHNPILKDIKTRFTLAYNMAVSASNVLKKHYQKSISDDEIAYFALHINLALERKKKNIKQKKNIIIVCGSGRGTSQLLMYRFKEEFGNYLNRVEAADLLSLKSISFENIDYVVSTVSIPFSIPVPILEIKYFLEENDMKYIKQVLNKQNNSSAIEYFDPRLFLCDVELETKEEVLSYMIDKIKEIKNIPDDFYQEIMKREELAPTEFGNLIAMPHPYHAVTDETFMSVMILNKPILWNKKKVQLIYLMSITNDANRDLQYLYKVTSKLLMNKKYIRDILQEKNYMSFCRIIQEIENNLGGNV